MATDIKLAVSDALKDGGALTPDLGGRASTQAAARAVIAHLRGPVDEGSRPLSGAPSGA
jgi:isocitrate/isopropylmalate dehydrogenase